MMLRGTTSDSLSDFVVGHEFHDHRKPSIASSSKKSIARSNESSIGVSRSSLLPAKNQTHQSITLGVYAFREG